MRIALVNNENNVMSSIARLLRARGHDVTLLLMGHEGRDWPHFHPSCDAFDLSYQAYTRTVRWGDGGAFASHDAREIAADLAPYDRVIGCGSTPAYMARIGRRLDVFVPLGADIGQAPFGRPRVNLRSLPSLVLFPLAQRAGILGARAVLAAESPGYMDVALARLGYRGERVFAAPPQVDTDTYSPEAAATLRRASPWTGLVDALRARSDVLVTMHGRHLFRTDPGQTRFVEGNPRFSKGNDAVLRGLALFKRRWPGVRVGLVTYEYGPDVEASRALVDELGLRDDVLWLPRTARKDILVNLPSSDLACGELGAHSWWMVGTVAEALAMARPLLHHRDDRQFLRPAGYPVFHARAPEHVATALEVCLEHPARAREMGRRGREWLVESVTRPGIAALERLLDVKTSRPGSPSPPRVGPGPACSVDARLLDHALPWIEGQLGFPLPPSSAPALDVRATSGGHALYAVKVESAVAIACREDWLGPVRALARELHPDVLFSLVGMYDLARVTLPSGYAAWGPVINYLADARTWQGAPDTRVVELDDGQLAAVDWGVFWHCDREPAAAFGVYEEGRLAALSTVILREGALGELSTDVAPYAIGRGLGRAVTSASGDYILRHRRCVHACAGQWNIGSSRTMRALGMRYSFAVMMSRPGPFRVPPQAVGVPLPGAEQRDYYPEWAKNRLILPRDP